MISLDTAHTKSKWHIFIVFLIKLIDLGEGGSHDWPFNNSQHNISADKKIRFEPDDNKPNSISFEIREIYLHLITHTNIYVNVK